MSSIVYLIAKVDFFTSLRIYRGAGKSRARVLASTQIVAYIYLRIYRGWQEVTGERAILKLR